MAWVWHGYGPDMAMFVCGCTVDEARYKVSQVTSKGTSQVEVTVLTSMQKFSNQGTYD